MLDNFVDAILDTLKLLPLLLAVYIIIEFVEQKTSKKVKYGKLLQGKFSPFLATAFGVVPQCGFSVIASNLYSIRAIRLSSLVAIFIATSDEAIPIMLANPSSYDKLWKLIVFKIVFALTVGYLLFFIEKLHDRKKSAVLATVDENTVFDKGCCKHDMDDGKKFDWDMILHPLVHSLKICLYIFIVNFVLNTVIYYIGADAIKAFLTNNRLAEPFVAGLVGLIPNCASSVILVELYIADTLSFGGVIAGLSVNAGLGMAVLLKQNKPTYQSILIMVGMYVLCSVAGLVANLVI